MSMMMSCKQYLFVLTSGQLDEAGWLTRAQAGQHRLLCRRCRVFARNDALLSEIGLAMRDQLLAIPSTDPDVQAGDIERPSS